MTRGAWHTGDAVVEKPLPNAFAQTDLAERLSGQNELVLVGFQTHMCVSSAARAALDLGFRVTVAADACATRALPDPVTGVRSVVPRSTATRWPSWPTASR